MLLLMRFGSIGKCMSWFLPYPGRFRDESAVSEHAPISRFSEAG
jgi:hypothetical protein